MEKRELTIEELEQLAMLMAQALPTLDCPECCGPVHVFIDSGADVYQEHWEWACLFKAITHARVARRVRISRS